MTNNAGLLRPQDTSRRERDIIRVDSRWFKRTIPRTEAMALIERVCRESGVTVDQIMARDKRGEVSATRTAAIRAVADAYPMASTVTIGRLFQRDHTTILYALRRLRKGKQ